MTQWHWSANQCINIPLLFLNKFTTAVQSTDVTLHLLKSTALKPISLILFCITESFASISYKQWHNVTTKWHSWSAGQQVSLRAPEFSLLSYQSSTSFRSFLVLNCRNWEKGSENIDQWLFLTTKQSSNKLYHYLPCTILDVIRNKFLQFGVIHGVCNMFGSQEFLNGQMRETKLSFRLFEWTLRRSF